MVAVAMVEVCTSACRDTGNDAPQHTHIGRAVEFLNGPYSSSCLHESGHIVVIVHLLSHSMCDCSAAQHASCTQRTCHVLYRWLWRWWWLWWQWWLWRWWLRR